MTNRLVMLIARLFLCLMVLGEVTNGQRPRITSVGSSGTPRQIIRVLYNGRWGTVCGHQFDDNAAAVFCRNLRGVKNGARVAGRFGTGSGPILLDEIMCHGNETRLDDCQYSDLGTQNCTHQDDVAVFCGYDSIRLVGGDSSLSGRVEIQYNGTWGTVCAHQFDDNAASAVCRELGYSRYAAKTTFAGRFGRGTGPIHFQISRCIVGDYGLNQCYHSDFGVHNCSRGEDAGVICVPKHIRSMRLYNGRHPYEGILRVQYDGTSGTVSDGSFDDNAARVVCAYLGYSVHGAVATHLGQSSGFIILGDVVCAGNETSLSDCQYRVIRRVYPHTNDVGVICGQKRINRLRLINGQGSYEGRVEVQQGGVWGTVCTDGFNDNAAKVVCAFLGYSVHGAEAILHAHFGQGTGPILFDDIICRGSESSLNECQNRGIGIHNCKHINDVGVICGQKQINRIRLVNGTNAHEGRLEVNYEGIWGSVCNTGFDNHAAKVVCTFLGYSGHGAVVMRHAHFGQGNGPVLLDDVSCLGTESSLNECHHSGFGSHDCKNRKDVGVICSQKVVNQVRLINGNNPGEGRLEVMYQGVWGTVCDDGFNDDAASVVCTHLGYLSNGAIAQPHAHYGHGPGPILLDGVICYGNESSLNDCQHRPFGTHDCTHGEDVGVICDQQLQMNPIRLVNGSNPREGRVEVLYDGVWGTVCDDEFNEEAAKVACTNAGFVVHHAAVTPQAHFGQGTGPILLDGIVCIGNESSLGECQHNGVGISNCEHGEDVGVICGQSVVFGYAIRLVNGRNPREGRVEVMYQGLWGTVCDDYFDNNGHAASVVCRQLGYPSLGAIERSFGPGTGPILLDDVNCIGNEASLFDCQHLSIGRNNCEHAEDAGVVCQ